MPRCWLLFVALLVVQRPAHAASFRIGAAVFLRDEPTRWVFGGLLQIELPLERLFRPAALTQASTSPSQPPPGASLPPAGPRVAAALRERSTALPHVLVREVVNAALRVNRDAETASRLESLSARARASSALPELVLRAARSTEEGLRLSPTTAERYEITQTGGADLLLEARATWNLDRLIFADDELRIEQFRVERAQASERLVALVMKHLFAWQRARRELASGPHAPAAELEWWLQLFEAEAMLDVLTNGFFSARSAQLVAPTDRALPLPVTSTGPAEPEPAPR